MKKILHNKILLLLIITIFLLLFSLGTNSYLKTITINEQKELTAPANWYESFTYELDNINETITLKRYNGNEAFVSIPATATIDGRTYHTIIVGTNDYNNSLFAYNESVEEISFDSGVIAGSNLRWLFLGCTNLKKVYFNNVNTSATTDMRGMFYDCTSLTTIDLRNIDTSNVTNMQELFYNCSSLETLDLSSFNTSSVTNMRGMFYECTSLKTIDLSNFNTSNVTTFKNMFYEARALKKLDLSSFNTSNATDFNGMFSYMTYLEELDLSSFDTRNATESFQIYHNATRLKKVKLGPNTKLHISDVFGAAPLTRGTYVRESDNAEFKAIDLFRLTDIQDMSGTYIKKSDLNTDMIIDAPVTYRINNNLSLNSISASSPIFKLENGNIYIYNISKPTTSDYNLNEYVEAVFQDAVTDEAGNKYDLEMRIDNFWLYDFDSYEPDRVTIAIARVLGEIELREASHPGTDLTTSLDRRDIKYDVTFRVVDKLGNPVEGNIIFSAYDIDVASHRDTLAEYNSTQSGYGDYNEGVNLIEGFDMSTLTVNPHTFLKITGNRIAGTRPDNSTEASEIVILADAHKTKFAWTGGGCGTTFFAYYQPRVVEIEKQDDKGNILPGAELRLYKGDSTTPFKTWTSTNESEKLFINPGEYTVKEESAPTGYNKSNDIEFYADIEDKLTINGNNVDKVIVKNTPKSYSYSIKYVDKDTNELITSTTDTSEYQSIINAIDKKKEFTNYTFDHWDKDSIVIDTNTYNNIIIMYYTRKQANLVVKYVDQNNNNIDSSKNRNETVLWGNNYTTTNYEFTNYDFVNITGDEPNGTISKDNYEIIYHYKLKRGTVTTHHYLFDGTETTTKLAPDVANTYDYTTTYNTSVSDQVPSNYELYRKTNNFTGVVSSPNVDVIYYYQLKDSSLVTTITKTGTEELTDADGVVNYEIKYEVEIEDYIGDASILIVDTLPCEIDTTKSNLNGGSYFVGQKEINWVIRLRDINTYEEQGGKYKTTITKNISVVYLNLDSTKRNMVNNVSGRINLSNKERVVTYQFSTDIRVKGYATIRYVDENDKEITESKEVSGLIGDEYTSEPIEIKGYVLKEKPNNEHITFTSSKQTITYVYERIKVNVKTRVDGKGGNIRGDESIYYGDDSSKDTIIIEADVGYVIAEILVNGKRLDIEPNLEELVLDNFKEVTEDKEVVVRFKEKAPDNPDTSLLTFKNIVILVVFLTIAFIYLEFISNKKIYRI